jgi:hypothetical protein
VAPFRAMDVSRQPDRQLRRQARESPLV